MSSQNEVNEEGTMVNTQTPITQTPETQTQKRKPHGITTMKSVVRSRSNNNKLTVEWNARGQLLNNKGGNKLFKHWSDDRLNAAKDIIWKDITATFDVDEEHKDYIVKSVGKALSEFRTNYGKCIRDAERNVNLKPPAKYANLIDEADWIEFFNYRIKDKKFLKISEQNYKRASNPIYSYKASQMGYRGVEEKILEESETPSSAAVDLDVLWVDARKNKQGVVDNEKVQEAVNRVVTLKERESFRTANSQVLLEKALGLPRYPGRIRGAGFGACKQFVTPSAKRLTKADAVVLMDIYDSLAE
ncbi:hypothetical protein Lal_00039772 [Lupinus albus]|nr:hypothetical protein Lal_00039772 [Lupinus albus]